jgi:hypothetical protein
MMSSKLVSRAIAISLAFAAAGASADSPHFVKGPTAALDGDGNYAVSFKEVGLGNQTITYSLTTTEATFTFQCFNPAGNKPQGDPNGQSFSYKSTFMSLDPRNGQITGAIVMSPEKGSASCQGNSMKLCLIAVDYKGVQFTELNTPIGPITMPNMSGTLAKPNCDWP